MLSLWECMDTFLNFIKGFGDYIFTFTKFGRKIKLKLMFYRFYRQHPLRHVEPALSRRLRQPLPLLLLQNDSILLEKTTPGRHPAIGRRQGPHHSRIQHVLQSAARQREPKQKDVIEDQRQRSLRIMMRRIVLF